MGTSYYFCGTSKSGFAQREGKDGLLMHAFILPCFLSFLYYFLSFFLFVLFTRSFLLLSCLASLFFLSLSFFLTFFLYYSSLHFYYFLPLGPLYLCIPPLGAYCSLTMGSSPLIYGYLPFLQRANSMIFLPFYPQDFTNCFWFVMGISLGLPTNPLVAQPLPLLNSFSLHHYSFHDKTPFCLFLL